MKKILVVLAALFCILILVLVLGKNLIAKITVEKVVTLVTGLPMSLQEIDVNLAKSSVLIKDLKVANPPGYTDPTMAQLPEFFVSYDLRAFLNKVVHLRELRIHLSELMVVKNAKGELNLNTLKSLQQKQAQTTKLHIDSMQLVVGKVTYKDYSLGTKPLVQEFWVDLNETYTNIDDPNALVGLIVVKALTNTTIASLTNFDFDRLKSMTSNSLQTSKDLAILGAGGTKDALNYTVQQTQGAFSNTPELASKTTGVLQDTTNKVADGVKGLFSLPFGKKDEKKDNP